MSAELERLVDAARRIDTERLDHDIKGNFWWCQQCGATDQGNRSGAFIHEPDCPFVALRDALVMLDGDSR